MPICEGRKWPKKIKFTVSFIFFRHAINMIQFNFQNFIITGRWWSTLPNTVQSAFCQTYTVSQSETRTRQK